jgi:hypothetical protein
MLQEYRCFGKLNLGHATCDMRLLWYRDLYPRCCVVVQIDS